ncbi:hypothetical protein HPB47_014148, partial [Ixodes persulcatus]
MSEQSYIHIGVAAKGGCQVAATLDENLDESPSSPPPPALPSPEIPSSEDDFPGQCRYYPAAGAATVSAMNTVLLLFVFDPRHLKWSSASFVVLSNSSDDEDIEFVSGSESDMNFEYETDLDDDHSGDERALLEKTSCPLRANGDIWFGCCSCTYFTRDQHGI